MAVSPTGAPAWTRTASFEHYGGHANKQNYLSRGAIDPLTDVSAEEFARATADLAAAVRTANFGVFEFTCNDTSPAAPTVNFAAMMTGVRTTPYAGDSAPVGFPAVARDGDGEVTFTFASTYTDEYGVVGAFTPRSAVATAGVQGAFASYVISGQDVTVFVYDDEGNAVQDARVTLEVS